MTLLNNILRLSCLIMISTCAIGQLEWSSPMLTADSGDVIGVDINVVDYEGLISSQGTVEFDPEVLEYLYVDSLALPSISGASFGETEIANGLLSFSWFESDLTGKSIPDGDAAFRIFFNVIGDPGDMSMIDFVNQPVPGEFVDTTFTPVGFTFVQGRVIVNGGDLSIDNLENSPKYNVYPNPASDYLFIEGKMPVSEVAIYDMKGALVQEKKWDAFSAKIDLPDLHPGIYMVRVKTNSRRFYNQLIQIQ